MPAESLQFWLSPSGPSTKSWRHQNSLSLLVRQFRCSSSALRPYLENSICRAERRIRPRSTIGQRERVSCPSPHLFGDERELCRRLPSQTLPAAGMTDEDALPRHALDGGGRALAGGEVGERHAA